LLPTIKNINFSKSKIKIKDVGKRGNNAYPSQLLCERAQGLRCEDVVACGGIDSRDAMKK
jgi:hypothetical protein